MKISCQATITKLSSRSKQIRNFSPVKSLDWCSPGREKRASDWSNKGIQSDKDESPLSQFGIIAAMSKNGVIGLNGRLPWNTIPEDRNYFNEITRDKILILGRKSFEEDPSSLTHVHKCIVLSRTLNQHSYDQKFVEVVSSFSDALLLAQLTQREKKEKEKKTSECHDALDCWIAGGERIYQQALTHPSAKELHLTIIDIDNTDNVNIVDKTSSSVVRFPPSYRWDHYFRQAKSWDQSDTSSEYNYKFYIYRRKR